MDGKISINGYDLTFTSGIYIQFKKYLKGTAVQNGVFTYDISEIKNPIIIPIQVNTGYFFISYIEGKQFKVKTSVAEDVAISGSSDFTFAVYGG